MAVVDTTLINYLGKKVSFSSSNGFDTYRNEGILTDVVISISSNPQISIDHGDFYLYSEVTDFLVID